MPHKPEIGEQVKELRKYFGDKIRRACVISVPKFATQALGILCEDIRQKLCLVGEVRLYQMDICVCPERKWPGRVPFTLTSRWLEKDVYMVIVFVSDLLSGTTSRAIAHLKFKGEEGSDEWVTQCITVHLEDLPQTLVASAKLKPGFCGYLNSFSCCIREAPRIRC